MVPSLIAGDLTQSELSHCMKKRSLFNSGGGSMHNTISWRYFMSTVENYFILFPR